MDPRNPARPDGDAGNNWAYCVECGRAAHHARDIRHTKRCPTRRATWVEEHAASLARMRAAVDAAFPPCCDVAVSPVNAAQEEA
jgi:hypothetical protein